jgi:hypothetical protein
MTGRLDAFGHQDFYHCLVAAAADSVSTTPDVIEFDATFRIPV